MSQVSKYPVRKDVEERMAEIFVSTIAKLQGANDIKDFFADFLSPVEKIVLAKRLTIAVLLAKGYSYPSIRQVLKVSPPTIATVSINMKYAGKGYNKVVKEIMTEERNKEFWGKIEDLLTSLPPSRGNNINYLKDRFDSKQRKRKKVL